MSEREMPPNSERQDNDTVSETTDINAPHDKTSYPEKACHAVSEGEKQHPDVDEDGSESEDKEERDREETEDAGGGGETTATSDDPVANNTSISTAAAASENASKASSSVPQEESSVSEGTSQADEHATKVAFVYNLPKHSSYHELSVLAEPFGPAQKIHLVRMKRQAFIQFPNEECAAFFIDHVRQTRLVLRGAVLGAAPSRRKEVVLPDESQRRTMEADENPPSRVLLVTVLHCMYPVNVDVLQQVFGRFGGLLKIIIFSRNENISALVEFGTVETATAAKVSLDGQCIYTDCNTLRVQFSRMDSITVKYNNEKSRDFTDPTLPSMPEQTLQQSPHAGFSFPANEGIQMGYSPVSPTSMESSSATNGHAFQETTSVVLVSGFRWTEKLIDHLFTLFGVYGDVLRVKVLYKKQKSALVQYAHPMQAELAQKFLDGAPFFGKCINVEHSKFAFVIMPKESDHNTGSLAKDFTDCRRHRFLSLDPKLYSFLAPPNPVLRITNINEGTSEEDLTNLVSSFGIVSCVSIVKNYSKCAKVRMQTTNDAVMVLLGIHGYHFEGRALSVTFWLSR